MEEAEGGTLFLDEIGDFSPAIQVKLLRVLQEREFERVGSNRTVKADVRVIAATNQDLEARVAIGPVSPGPVLSDQRVSHLSAAAARNARTTSCCWPTISWPSTAKKMGKEVRRISTPAINMMFAYHWPGNVRELENCIEYAVLLSNDGVIHGHNLPPTLQMPETSETERRRLAEDSRVECWSKTCSSTR